MKSYMDLSIIVPVYNVEKYIKKCIDELTYTNIPIKYEIIIVNDGSTDKSRDIVIDIIKKHKGINIKLLDKKNGGLSSARNYGLNFAKGTYVFFLDSDDFIDILEIYRIYKLAIKDKCDLVIGNGKFYFEDNSEENKHFYSGNKLSKYLNYENTYTGKEIFQFMIQNNCYKMEVWDKIYSRDFLINNNIYFLEGILHEDELFTPTVLSKASKVRYIGDINYNYRQRLGSITKTPGIRSCRDYIKVINELEKIIKHDDYEFDKALAKRIVELYFRVIQVSLLFENSDEKNEVKELLLNININHYRDFIGFNLNFYLRNIILVNNDRLYKLLYRYYKKTRRKLTGKL